MRVAVIGAGWAGCAAAVEAARQGHEVLLLEAARQAGGRARRLQVEHAGQSLALDNGQHILIGAYRDTLALMSDLGVAPERHLKRLPLTLQQPDGTGLRQPTGWPPTLAVLIGVAGARGWTWRDKLSLLRTALGWQAAGFACDPLMSVGQLCAQLTPQVMQTLIEPLCVSALNTPADQASGQVFLRVMQDALFSQAGGADLLLPAADLGALLPDAAMGWLAQRGHQVRLGTRVQALAPAPGGWAISIAGSMADEPVDAILLACPAREAARLVAGLSGADGWARQAQALAYEAIATVYATAPGARLAQPMLALPCGPQAPAQFVFDRGQLGGPQGLLAFVVSASRSDAAELQAQVLVQAQRQLALSALAPVATVVEKRATFACTPGLARPGMQVRGQDMSLLACGDYVDGPYPATLEGAVRSGLAAARALARA